MSITISILSETENVGKTTTAINLAVALGLFEKKTLLINNSSSNSKLPESLKIKQSENEIVSTNLHSLKYIGIGYEKTENLKILGNFDSSFDYIIINGPNIDNKLYDYVLAETDWIIIPFELKQKLINDLYKVVTNLKAQCGEKNYSYKLAGILLNRFNGNNDIEIDLFNKESIFFNTKIPEFNFDNNVFFSDIKSKVSGAYFDFAIELLEKTSMREIK